MLYDECMAVPAIDKLKLKRARKNFVLPDAILISILAALAMAVRLALRRHSRFLLGSWSK